MTRDQAFILAILLVTVGMFIWGRWRHDMVAVGALLATVLAGLLPGADAFAGFGHPAVITVACVLILSSPLQTTGAVDALTRWLLPRPGRPLVTIAALTGVGMALSAFMNNVGALALLMPVAIQAAAREGRPPGQILMPLAFGSLLGGMTTLIGTPPNLIVSGFRAGQNGAGFAMFDFAPVGVAVALVGGVFLVLSCRWLVPARPRAGAESFNTAAYLTEARITPGSAAAGRTLRQIEAMLDGVDAQVVGLVRDELRVAAPLRDQAVRADDVLVIEAEPEGLAAALAALNLKLEEDVRDPAPAPPGGSAQPGPDADRKPKKAAPTREAADAEDIALIELAVMPGAAIVGRSATAIRLRDRYGINLLAVSRQGRRSISRLRTLTALPGDVLLMQGPPDAVGEFAAQFGCVPLAPRPLRIPQPRQAWMIVGIMAVAIVAAAFGLVASSIAFTAAVLAAMAMRVVSPRIVYRAVDWPVIVLLGALIPVAATIETTGAAALIARLLLDNVAAGSPLIALIAILVVTMTMSDAINNAATAAMMCPIAIQTASLLAVNPDAFLMAVAIGASCAFLTPIGHQNNTLILGPGGFRFGDYWRLGLPLEIIVVAVSAVMLPLVWPL
jgi:di/tricarboxylate transporter